MGAGDEIPETCSESLLQTLFSSVNLSGVAESKIWSQAAWVWIPAPPPADVKPLSLSFFISKTWRWTIYPTVNLEREWDKYKIIRTYSEHSLNVGYFIIIFFIIGIKTQILCKIWPLPTSTLIWLHSASYTLLLSGLQMVHGLSCLSALHMLDSGLRFLYLPCSLVPTKILPLPQI